MLSRPFIINNYYFHFNHSQRASFQPNRRLQFNDHRQSSNDSDVNRTVAVFSSKALLTDRICDSMTPESPTGKYAVEGERVGIIHLAECRPIDVIVSSCALRSV